MKALLCFLCVFICITSGFVLGKTKGKFLKQFFSEIEIPDWSDYIVPDESLLPVGLRYEHPSGNDRSTRFSSSGDGNLHIQFIGTASCVASRTRGVSSLGLRYNGDVWMFDCGEGAQLSLRCSQLKMGNIKKIFITHLHGDHCFGLVGLLCSIGASYHSQVDNGICTRSDYEPIDIYGPEGLRNFVRSMAQLSFSKSMAPHRIHELKSVRSKKPQLEAVLTVPSRIYSELKGEDLYPDENGHYRVCDTADAFVTAAPLMHTVPCLGYVFNEKPLPGSLKSEVVSPLIEKHFDALNKLPELRYTAKQLNVVLKALKPDESYTLPDGQVLRKADVMGEDRPGRKIVVLGDTFDASAIEPLAMDADVLIHEATNAYFPREDWDYEQFEKVIRKHGHSTPQMAGAFAARIRAKKLLLNHFSSQFKGDDSLQSMQVMWAIEDMARDGATMSDDSQNSTQLALLQGPNDIVAAWDHLILPVPLPSRH